MIKTTKAHLLETNADRSICVLAKLLSEQSLQGCGRVWRVMLLTRCPISAHLVKLIKDLCYAIVRWFKPDVVTSLVISVCTKYSKIEVMITPHFVILWTLKPRPTVDQRWSRKVLRINSPPSQFCIKALHEEHLASLLWWVWASRWRCSVWTVFLPSRCSKHARTHIRGLHNAVVHNGYRYDSFYNTDSTSDALKQKCCEPNMKMKPFSQSWIPKFWFILPCVFTMALITN